MVLVWEPDVAMIGIWYVPGGGEFGPTITVIVAVPDPAKLWGLNEADAPVGSPLALSPIVPVCPEASTETKYATLPAGPVDWDVGDALMKKLPAVAKVAITLRGPVMTRFCGVAGPERAPPNPANECPAAASALIWTTDPLG